MASYSRQRRGGVEDGLHSLSSCSQLDRATIGIRWEFCWSLYDDAKDEALPFPFPFLASFSLYTWRGEVLSESVGAFFGSFPGAASKRGVALRDLSGWSHVATVTERPTTRK
jgi:hypothetical protein